ncbi:MAG: hypothetical protein Q8918_14365 [Bacteroidota bacterium]|nr:hypothetical protein [Bacteroidota bacterium]MDP4251286.1 hypothetical protein [Bacteroidota bacterium]
MSTEDVKKERAKKIRKLLTRWKKRQQSKQKELPFQKAKTAFLHHSNNHSEKMIS